MANSLSADFIEVWAREQQRKFFKKAVAPKIADVSFNALLAHGDTLNRPYRSVDRPAPYVRGTAITIDDKTDTNEQLTVNGEFALGMYLDEHDVIQSNYDLAARYGEDFGKIMSMQIDADVLGEAQNALSTVDDGTLGGTSGNGIAVTTSNVMDLFGAAKEKLMLQNADDEGLFAVLSPQVEHVLVQYGAGRDTIGGDKVMDNGFFGNFYGFKLYRSNNTLASAVLALATNPTNGDTVTISGVTFTFVSSIGSTPGNVLIGVDVDTTRASFAGMLNNPTTTSATQVALSAANARIFDANCTATNDNTANTLTVKLKGAGTMVVSETLTDATDGWTATKQKQHLLFGVEKQCPTLVVQKYPIISPRPVQDKMGQNILSTMLYGYKTFNDNSKLMVNIEVKSSSYTAPAYS